jgi:hypothetical protein
MTPRIIIETKKAKRDFPLTVAGVKDAIDYLDAAGNTVRATMGKHDALLFLEDCALGFISAVPGRDAETEAWIKDVARIIKEETR